MLSFVFLTTSLFTAFPIFVFKFTGTVFNLPTSKSSIFVYKLYKPLGNLTNLLIPSAFKALKCL